MWILFPLLIVLAPAQADLTTMERKLEVCHTLIFEGGRALASESPVNRLMAETTLPMLMDDYAKLDHKRRELQDISKKLGEKPNQNDPKVRALRKSVDQETAKGEAQVRGLLNRVEALLKTSPTGREFLRTTLIGVKLKYLPPVPQAALSNESTKKGGGGGGGGGTKVVVPVAVQAK